MKDKTVLDQDYLYLVLGSSAVYAQFEKQATGGVVNNLNSGIVAAVEIPLPPLEVQREIVAEVEGYQRVIDGNRDLIARFEKKIDAAIARVWGEPRGEGAA